MTFCFLLPIAFTPFLSIPTFLIQKPKQRKKITPKTLVSFQDPTAGLSYCLFVLSDIFFYFSLSIFLPFLSFSLLIYSSFLHLHFHSPFSFSSYSTLLLFFLPFPIFHSSPFFFSPPLSVFLVFSTSLPFLLSSTVSSRLPFLFSFWLKSFSFYSSTLSLFSSSSCPSFSPTCYL